ncbi:tetratricopeptide repeat protein [Halobaculum rarum]|uniref:tetratricopeptide repeat protein n=1 Tax=Halobaculum rarum TaxID=3075122 RepID=UPI0032AF3B52
MSSDTTVDEVLALVESREDFLRTLRDGPLFKRDIIDRLDTSRSTVDRVVDDLRGADLIASVDGGYRTTETGELVLERFEAFHGDLSRLIAASDVIEHLPDDAALPAGTVARARTHAVDTHHPRDIVSLVEDALTGAEAAEALLPRLSDSTVLDAYLTHARRDGTRTKIAVSESLDAALRGRSPETYRSLVTAGSRVFRGAVPPYGLVVCRGARDVALVIVYTDLGGIAGVLELTDPDAVDGLADRVDDRVADAKDVTDAVGRLDVPTAPAERQRADRLPVELESEGVALVTDDLLARREATSLLQAWRTGISLADVDAGHPVERGVGETADVENEHDGSGGENGIPDRTTAAVRDHLTTGEDVILTGPPGSGKSTTCKRVAVEWHREGRGPVCYRAADARRSFESVAAARRAIEELDGHVLVVFEDVPSPGARAALDLRAEFTARSDVSFLFDARTPAWEAERDSTSLPGPSLVRETMPSLSVGDCDALLRRAARHHDSELPLTPEELHESVAGGTDGDAVGAFFVAVHRVARLADPLAVATDDAATSLSAAARGVFDRLRSRGRLAVDVGVWVALLNLANVPLRPEYVHPLGDEAFVEDALDVLEGSAVFVAGSDPLATPPETAHDAWSTAFLAHALATLGERGAQETLGRSLTAVLDAADGDIGGADFGRPGDGKDPTDDWRERLMVNLFEVIRARPRLAGFVGETFHGHLPSAVAALDRHRWHGRLALGAGDPAEATAAFEHLLSTATDHENPHAEAAARRGLGAAALQRSAYETAVEYLTAGLALAVRLDDGPTVVRCLLDLGTVAQKRGRADLAAARYEAAHERATALGEDLLVARCRKNLGTVAANRPDYEAALGHARAAMETFEAADEPLSVANCLANAANALTNLGEYDRAAGYYERAVDLQAELGDDHGRAGTLTSLGDLERRRGNDERALSYLERAESLYRRIGDDHRLAICLNNLGIVRKDLARLEAAVATHREAVEIREEIGNPHEVGMSEHNLAVCALERGDVETAEELARDSMRHLDEAGNQRSVGVTRSLLADVLVERGERDAASDQLERGIAELRDCGADPQARSLSEELATLHLNRGDVNAAHASARAAREPGVDDGAGASAADD